VNYIIKLGDKHLLQYFQRFFRAFHGVANCSDVTVDFKIISSLRKILHQNGLIMDVEKILSYWVCFVTKEVNFLKLFILNVL